MGGTALEAGNLADTGMNDTSAAAAQVDQTVTTNNGTLIGIQNNHEIQRLRGIPLTDDWIRRRLGGYVGDDDTAKALGAILDIHRVGVIHAGAGTGRYTTALHTLKRLGVQTIRQVRRMPDEKIELEGLLDEDTGWILDLRHETQLLPTTTGLHLTEVADHLIKTARSSSPSSTPISGRTLPAKHPDWPTTSAPPTHSPSPGPTCLISLCPKAN